MFLSLAVLTHVCLHAGGVQYSRIPETHVLVRDRVRSRLAVGKPRKMSSP